MKKICLLASLLLLTVCALAAKPPGIKPRARVTEYIAVQETNDLAIGVTPLSAKEVRRQFVSNLGKDYVVIEIGIFPKSETKLSPQDFTLRVKGEKDELPPADPTVMAAKINQKDQSGRDIDVYPTMGIEYRSADDPLTGERKGTRTSTGVVAEVHDRQKTPKTSQADERAMQAELSEQALPEVTVAQPVAGYLYFSAPHGNSATYELTYHGKNGTVVVPLP